MKSPTASSAPSESRSPSDPLVKESGSRAKSRGHRWLYVVTVVVVAALLGSGVYFITTLHQGSSGSGKLVLQKEGSYYTLPAEEFNGITFIVNESSVINGTFFNTYGVDLFQMTPTQYLTFTRSAHLSGYEWNANVTAETIYDLNLTVPPGAWVLAFVNPNTTQTTLVGFYTDLTLSTA